jgi:hypothetical protein
MKETIVKYTLAALISITLVYCSVGLMEIQEEDYGIQKYQCYYYRGRYPIQIVTHHTKTHLGVTVHYGVMINESKTKSQYFIEEQDLDMELVPADCNHIPAFRKD